MKLKSARPVGCGYRSNHYHNHEGYSDPTAGAALSGCPDIHAVSKRRKPSVREKVVRRKLPLVSEMDEYLASLAKKEGYGKIWYVFQEGKWKTGIIPAKDAGTDM